MPAIRTHLVLAIVCAPLLMGGACEKKPKAPDNGAIAALDNANAGSDSAAGSAAAVDTTPLTGIDISKLSAERQQLFYQLVSSLSSPCGKAHSLRTSFSSDTSCKHAPYAVRYIASLLEDEAPETFIREEFDKRYKAAVNIVKLDVSRAPHVGAETAPIKLVEFFDYGCPHCKAFRPVLEQVLADEGDKVVAYFMNFPLSKHTDSRSAAQAALAAAAQGKFKEMHELLFNNAPEHDHSHVTDYAKSLGLDLTKFEAAYNDEASHVASDAKQGEDSGVEATPTLFVNNRKYEGPMQAKYIEPWLEEELAVNR